LGCPTILNKTVAGLAQCLNKLTNREGIMNYELTPKKDIYRAVGFALLLLALSFPLSILGIKLLNFVLGQIQI